MKFKTRKKIKNFENFKKNQKFLKKIKNLSEACGWRIFCSTEAESAKGILNTI
jgi:hypothetical protein